MDTSPTALAAVLDTAAPLGHIAACPLPGLANGDDERQEHAGMRGIVRLIDGLLSGDAQAVYILAMAVVATLIIFLISEVAQRRRKQRKRGDS
jgi:hypothetical protein